MTLTESEIKEFINDSVIHSLRTKDIIQKYLWEEITIFDLKKELRELQMLERKYIMLRIEEAENGSLRA